MKLKNKSITANENSIFLGAAYYGEDQDGSNLRKLKYRDDAKRLIEKHWKSPFKVNANSSEYHHIEFSIVNELEIADRWHKPGVPASVQWPIEIMARRLEISPVVLYNDPDLPDFLLRALNNKAN